jgi:hypothetical protein
LVDSGGGFGSRWVRVGCGVARGGFVGWLAEVVVGLWGGLLRWCSESRGLQVGFWLIPVGGLVHGGSGLVAGWLVVGLWGGLLRWWWVFCPFRWCWGVFYFSF